MAAGPEITGLDKLAIPLPVGCGAGDLVLFAVSGDDSVESDDCPAVLSQGWRGRLFTGKGLPPVGFYRKDGGQSCVRLLENRIYEWSIEGADIPHALEVKSSLENKNRRRWSVRRKGGRAVAGSFQVVNHLGAASFQLTRADGADGAVAMALPLEVVSNKIDYDAEYRKMTEDIAEFCEQLLLNWNTPTSLTFSPNAEERNRLLLEQYLFLAHYLTEERIGRVMEAIERFPHSELRRESEWKPPGMARSTEFLSNPGGMLRDWRRPDGAGGRPVPGQVLDVRKSDSTDTDPNRFVKFALESFRELCRRVGDCVPADSTVAGEAGAMRKRLDGLLGRSFFRSIGRMRRLPLDNQTLQKREGYRELLRAWILTGAASSLSWEGNRDCYDGTTRDVATLYEYWVFIQLHGALSRLPQIEWLNGANGNEDFVKPDGRRLVIQLKAGRPSRSSFLWTGPDGFGLRIDLYYERTFSQTANVRASGSYSRQFRPDYSLAIYPAAFGNEDRALEAGKLAHLHFDAKYRAEKLSQLFGKTKQNDESLEEEKREAKAESTYKRGDLLKMHTYNDALRHSIGAYVLYPGDSGSPDRSPQFHEIAPGVGAYSLKPGRPEFLAALSGFLSDVFEHQADRFSQFSYLRDATSAVVREQPVELGGDYRISQPHSQCVLLWMEESSEPLFRENGLAYCHAVYEEDARNNKDLNLEIAAEVGAEFVPYRANRTLGWRGKVTAVNFVTIQKLREWLAANNLDGKFQPGTRKRGRTPTHYLLFQFGEVTAIPQIDIPPAVLERRSGSQYMALTCRWSELMADQVNY